MMKFAYRKGIKNKYRNVEKTCKAGHKHPSQKEALRCDELHMLEKRGVIQSLKVQEAFLLSQGKTKQESIKYIADFTYFQDGEFIVEDVKGFKTEAYKIKKKLMKNVHNIDILEL